MGDIYSITGFYEQSSVFCPFGGFFITKFGDKPSELPLPLEGLVVELDGLLADVFGQSKIHGELSDTSLKFAKKYAFNYPAGVIDYTFKRNEKNIWIGEYSVNASKGSSTCVIAPYRKNLEFNESERIGTHLTEESIRLLTQGVS